MTQATNHSITSATKIANKQLLWINKIIKLPINSSGKEDVQADLAEIICYLSPEFLSHKHELKSSFELCTFGSTHKKVTVLFILTNNSIVQEPSPNQGRTDQFSILH
jgi:hypothetical protein